jgi:hypothetical protein
MANSANNSGAKKLREVEGGDVPNWRVSNDVGVLTFFHRRFKKKKI